MPVVIRPKTKSKVAVPKPPEKKTPYVFVIGQGMQRREDVERARQPRKSSIRIVPKKPKG